MYDTILVPTDGSEPAGAAVDHAVDLAANSGATLHALSVVDSSAYASLDVSSEQVLDSLETRAGEATETIAETAADAGVETVTEVSIGSPHEQITDYAEAVDADLIVMGTHGRTGLDRFLLGSVTERVVRAGPCPVLTVRAAES
ncbi:universal stress protein [Halonotius aquaticus]|uniref:Universal stress protein n=1 Tax=Halonotius aquaticus TaxID=2216978 RepID=A0A3A6PPS6_9EURY|nr:universal stress protein [Halonotius aquaticus]RJX43706.1 universal stress protein [Halonotius aquaticus]